MSVKFIQDSKMFWDSDHSLIEKLSQFQNLFLLGLNLTLQHQYILFNLLDTADIRLNTQPNIQVMRNILPP